MSEMSKEQMKKLKASLLMNKAHEEEDALVPAYVRMIFRNVLLSNEEGRFVLAHLLELMGYNTKISHPQEIGIHNVAQGILDILGVGSEQMMAEALATWALLPPED